jgi:hypothetical protein
MNTTDIPVSNTLQRLHTLPTIHDSLSIRRALLPIDHFLGVLVGYHYVAFTKIPLVCSCSLGFASRTNTVLLPKVGVGDRYPPGPLEGERPLHGGHKRVIT